MEWIKDYTDSDHHPQLLRAGFWGAFLFKGLCRLSGKFGWRGPIPSSYLDPEALAIYFHIPQSCTFNQSGQPDDILDPWVIAEQALAACYDVGLLIQERDGANIPGWERKQPSDSYEANRSRNRRLAAARPESDRSPTENRPIDIDREVEVDKKKKLHTQPSAACLAVFESYRALWANSGPSKPGKKQAKAIQAMLDSGWSVDELSLVAHGAMLDAKRWPERLLNMGGGVLFRDEDQVQKFVDLARGGGGPSQPAAKSVNQGIMLNFDEAMAAVAADPPKERH